MNATDAKGDTPLHTICSRPLGGGNAKDVAALLLAYGADKDLKNKAGQTPSQVALMTGSIEMSDLVKKWPTEDQVAGALEIGQ